MFKIIKNEKQKYYKNLTKEDKKYIYGLNPKYKNQESKLLQLYGECDNLDKKLKMIVITDTHSCLIEEEFSRFVLDNNEYDVCLLLGDHSVGDINIILKYIDREKIYALLGNHDGDYIKEFNLKSLNGNIIEIKGVTLLGIQGSYRYKPENFPSFSQKESIEFLDSKGKVDILVSHDAPFEMSGRNDVAHQGLFGITYYLFKNKVPYCIHGHLHTKHDKEMVNGTKVKCCHMYEYIEIK